MTPEEVIEIIKAAQAEVEWNYPMDYAAAFGVAIGALEKQIPKKPIDEGWLYCPICEKDILLEGYKFCPNCGQKICWEGE